MSGRGPRISADRLEKRFADKSPPLTATEAIQEAARCIYCYEAPCIQACPTSIDIPTFIRKISTGNVRGAARTIYEANLLGASCARVCPVEVLCEGSCVYVPDGRRAVSIGRLQRHATDHGGSPAELRRKTEKAGGGSVALVGGGPASLSCAGELALLGHRPVIYEKNELPGGLNTTGVAPYKFQAEDALAEVDAILQLGVGLRTGVTVGGDVTAEQLLEEHDAVFLGPGLGPDSRLGVPGEEGPGVIGAVDWIERMKTNGQQTMDGVRSAIVVGGGNTAVDAARELKGLGAEAVTMVYRREAKRMGAYLHELEPARKEGVAVLDRAAIAEVFREDGGVSGVRLVATEDGRPTDRELRSLPADLVVVAIGQSKLRELVAAFPDVACDDRGRIVADEATGATGNPRVFAGGDARNGGREVVNAVEEGKVAARSIDALIRKERAGG